MLTGPQIRQARKLLRWDRPTLSRNALVSQALLQAAESSDGPAWLTDEQEAGIRRACEEAGIRFETDAEGVPVAVMARTVA